MSDVEVVDVRALVGSGAERQILWSTESSLQANLVRLAPGEVIQAHTEHVLDVLVTVIEGQLVLTVDDRPRVAAAPSIVVLPAGTRRALAAGPNGATYLTTHRRRDGLMPAPR